MDDMVGHLCSISKKRFIISFAPYTPIYAALKMLGSLAPGPSKVCGLCGWGWGSWERMCCQPRTGGGTCQILPQGGVGIDVVSRPFPAASLPLPLSHCPYLSCPPPAAHARCSAPPRRGQATRAYLHAEADVVSALEKRGFKVPSLLGVLPVSLSVSLSACLCLPVFLSRSLARSNSLSLSRFLSIFISISLSVPELVINGEGRLGRKGTCR